jgi:hypothetical protein
VRRVVEAPGTQLLYGAPTHYPNIIIIIIIITIDHTSCMTVGI